MSLVSDTRRLAGRLARLDSESRALSQTEYHFLLGRFVNATFLAQATATAARWGVHPHEVLIATGWLKADDYYRALAEACGTTFKADLPPSEVGASRREPEPPTMPRPWHA